MSSLLLRLLLLLATATTRCSALVVPLQAANPSASLAGVSLPRVNNGGDQVDLGAALATASTSGKVMLVLGTHAADFNCVEYMQRIRAFWTPLTEKRGIERCMVVVNGEAAQALKLAELVDLPEAVELYADPTGEAGRRFGVSRGFRPDDTSLSPFAKLFFMGIGIGPPWQTLPAVLTGYFGNPSGKRAWIEAALRQGQLAGRWPDSVLELSADGSEVVGNRFDDTPLVSGWGVRPFELATLRLQNLIGVQGTHWDELKPADSRCLTQLGGCVVVGDGGTPLYSWLDQGLCDVPDFDELLEAL